MTTTARQSAKGTSKFRAPLLLLIVVALVISVLVAVKIIHDINDDSSIHIGALLSLTGDAANYGKRSLNGLDWAVYQINERGGIKGRTIQLDIEDAASSPALATSAVIKLIKVHNSRIVIGDIISGTTIAAEPITSRNGVLLFAPGASHPSLTDAGPLFFRNWTSDTYDGFAMARHLISSKVMKIGLIVQNTDYTVGLADALQKEFKKGGGSVVLAQNFQTDATDLRTLLLKFKELSVDAVYISAYSGQTGRILLQAGDVDYHPDWYATLTVDTPECRDIAGKHVAGVVFTTPAFDVGVDSPQMHAFVSGFKERYGEDPEAVAGHAYDAAFILADAIRSVGTDPQDVAQYLHNLRKYPGVTGLTTFNSNNGDVTKDIFVKRMKKEGSDLISVFIP